MSWRFDPPIAARQSGVLVLLFVAAFSSLWHLHVYNRRIPSTHSDLIQRWVGTRAALQGKDPYSAEVLRDIQTVYYGHPITAADEVEGLQRFLYPAPIILILSPLAPLSWKAARLVFLAIVSPLFAASLWLCFHLLRLPITRGRLAFALIVSLCSWPVIWGLRFQQPTFLAAALIFIASYLFSRRYFVSAGALFAISLFKPQVVFLLLAGLLLWAAIQRTWSFLASFAITVTVLLFWTERIVPGWIPHWVASLQGYSRITNTALPLEILFGHWVGLVVTTLIIAWSFIVLWRLRKCALDSAKFGIAVSLALSVAQLLIPTHLTLIYNQVLLFPACILVIYQRAGEQFSRFTRGIALALLVIGLTLPSIAVLLETTFGPRPLFDGMPHWTNAFLSPFLTLALLSMQSQFMHER